jgi:hypothetical protein
LLKVRGSAGQTTVEDAGVAVVEVPGFGVPRCSPNIWLSGLDSPNVARDKVARQRLAEPPTAEVEFLSPEFGSAARTLLAEGTSSTELAEIAVRVCGRLARHLARLLGDTSIQMLLKRCIVLASAQFPWLAVEPDHDSALSGMRVAMEQQDPDSIIEAFVSVMATFIGMLERLIGEGLVERLLEEVFPAVFTHAPKDPP